MQAKGVLAAEPVDDSDSDVEMAAVADTFEASNRESAEHFVAVSVNIWFSTWLSYLAILVCAFVSLGLTAGATSDANVWIPVLIHLAVIGLDTVFTFFAWSPLKRCDVENRSFIHRITLAYRPAARVVRFVVWMCIALMWESRPITFEYESDEEIHTTEKYHGMNIAYAVAIMSASLDVVIAFSIYAVIWSFVAYRRCVKRPGTCRSVAECFVREPDRAFECFFNECVLCNLFKH